MSILETDLVAPRLFKVVAYFDLVEDTSARFPIDGGQMVTVSQFEWVSDRYLINCLLGSFAIAERNLNPGVLEDVRQLSKKLADRRQTVGKHFMHAFLYGVTIAHVVDIHRRTPLSDPLYTPFALLQARGVPGQVQVDQATESLQIQALGGRIGADQQSYLVI